jgi:hypothetical protein
MLAVPKMLATVQGPEMITPPVLHPALSLEIAGLTFLRADILQKEP